MVCATGMLPIEMVNQLEEKFGYFEMVEANLAFVKERKPEIEHILMAEKRLPNFYAEVTHVSY